MGKNSAHYSPKHVKLDRSYDQNLWILDCGTDYEANKEIIPRLSSKYQGLQEYKLNFLKINHLWCNTLKPGAFAICHLPQIQFHVILYEK